MEELQLRLLEKELTTIFFLFWGKKPFFLPKNGGTMKHVIALSLYIGTNILVYERRLMVNVWSMTKKSFCVKKPFFTKNALFSKIMSQIKRIVWLIQAPNISKHVSRNGGATVKASQKQLMTKSFYFAAKRPFYRKKNGGTIKKKL